MSEVDIVEVSSIIDDRVEVDAASSRFSNQNEKKEEKEEEIVAVGSISHVLKTAFRDFLAPKSNPVSNHTSVLENAPVEDEVEGSEVEGDQVQEETSIVENDEEDHDTAQEDIIKEEVNSLHPYVLMGQERIATIQAHVAVQHDQAKALMTYLSHKHQEASTADEEEALRIQKTGLVVKSQIPIGASQLHLKQEEAAQFGSFGENLIVAHDFFQANKEAMLDRSGNGPTAQRKAVTYVAEAPGYLKTTSSNEIRSTLAKATFRESTKKKTKTILVSSMISPKKENTKSIVPHLTGDEIDASATILNRMTHKLGFLRNPRYDSNVTSKGLKSICSGQIPERVTRNDDTGNRGYFSLFPSQVLFTEYGPGGLYETTVAIKNICGVTRRFRILPPSSSFFSIVSVKFPLKGQSVLAPGMNCIVTVQFAPDTAGDFTDTLVVESEMGRFSVDVLGRRSPPILSIPQLLDVGPCLVGDVSTTVLHVLNSGGKAKFWLLTESEWEASKAPPTEKSQELDLHPFWISPTEFELDTSDEIEMKIVYAPTTQSCKEQVEHRVNFIMVCDNCQIKTFGITGKGVVVDIAVSSINAKNIFTKSAVNLLQFNATSPKTTSVQTVEIVNHTPIELAFAWEVNGQQDGGFTIEPPRGLLTANGSHAFQILFHPRKAPHFYDNQAEFTLENIPYSAIQGENNQEALGILQETISGEMKPPSIALQPRVKAMTIALNGYGQEVALALNPLAFHFTQELFLGESYSREVTLYNPSEADCAITWELDDSTYTDCSHPPIEGNAIPQWPKASEEGSEGMEQSNVPMPSIAPTYCNVTITPAAFILPPKSLQRFQLSLTPHRVGHFEVTVPCILEQGMGNPLSLPISFGAISSTIGITPSMLDFGLVAVGGTSEDYIEICNPNQGSSLRFALRQVDTQGPMNQELKRTSSSDSVLPQFSMASSSDSKSTAMSTLETPIYTVLEFVPPFGVLQPNSKLKVLVRCCTGRNPEAFRGCIEVHSAQDMNIGPSSMLRVSAEVQSPHVYCSTTKILLGTSFIGVPVIRTVELVNLSNLSAPFKWLQPSGRVPSFTADFEPKRGTLLSKERLIVTITYTPKSPGKIEALFACNIHGMTLPLGFQLETMQKALVLVYNILEEGDLLPEKPTEEETPKIVLPKIAFGETVPLFERKTVRLLMRNYSGIPATISLSSKKNAAASSKSTMASLDSIKTSGSTTQSTVAVNTSSHVTLELPHELQHLPREILGENHELRDLFTSLQGKKHVNKCQYLLQDREILKGAGGMAVRIEPEVVELDAWDQCTVTITCFNDMPGKYSDTLIAQPVGYPPTRIPTSITVVGCPLSFDTNCVGFKSLLPTSELLWGQVPHHTNPMTKTVCVRNTGPIDARLVWSITTLDERPVPLANVKLNVQHSGVVQLTIAPNTEPRPPPLYSIEPSVLEIKHHSLATFTITFEVPTTPIGSCRALLSADAEWLHPTENKNAIINPSNASSKTSLSPAPSTGSLKTAVGKAFRAARSINSLHSNASAPSTQLETKTKNALNLTLSSFVIEPYLHVDKQVVNTMDRGGKRITAEGKMKFTAWSTTRSHHPSLLRSIHLMNRMASTLRFTLDTSGPFALIQVNQRADKDTIDTYSIPPGDSLQADVSFLHDRFSQKVSKNNSNSTNLRSEMEGALQLTYANASVQQVLLRGVVLRPCIVASPSEYCFGTVYVSTNRIVTIFLSNPTQVDAVWSIKHITAPLPISRAQKAAAAAALTAGELPVQDIPDVFDMSIRNGTLQGPTVPLGSVGFLLPTDPNRTADATTGNDRAPLSLQVTFTPPSIGRYKCRFRFQVTKGESFDVVLQGYGTLQEGGETAADRPTLPSLTFTHSDSILK